MKKIFLWFDTKSRGLYQTIILGSTDPGARTVSLSSLFDQNQSLAAFFSKLFTAALAVGAILAVLRLGYAGFLYMTSDVWSNKQRATTMIQEVVLGLLLLLSVWLILNQINPDILKLNILQNITPALAPPAGVDDRVTPQQGVADGVPCIIPGLTDPGIMQEGTCRFAPSN